MNLYEWFLSLPRPKRDMLHGDKWMLADSAFEAGKASRDVEIETIKRELQQAKDEVFWMSKRMQS